jgi:hypothetical protein
VNAHEVAMRGRPALSHHTAGAPSSFQEHLANMEANLEAAGLPVRADREINKDADLHPPERGSFRTAAHRRMRFRVCHLDSMPKL